MITFKQLETGLPPDIEVQTDDADGEMADMQEAWDFSEDADFEVGANLAACTERDDDGYFVFVIPGDEAGDLGDYYNPLAEYLDSLSRKAMEALGGDE